MAYIIQIIIVTLLLAGGIAALVKTIADIVRFEREDEVTNPNNEEEEDE